MSWAAAALLVSVTARTGKTADISAAASQAVALDSAAAAVSESVLWSFGATSDDGVGPSAGLIADKWGNLYGTTPFGGANGSHTFPAGPGPGTVFELTPPTGQQTQWSESVLWSFGATSDDGQGPSGGLIADKWGNLYGTTASGGANFLRAGTVFELTPPTGQQTQWSESVLWSFGATSDDGRRPSGGLIADKRGNLYGTTAEGGANALLRAGTVFELSPPHGKQTQWSESVLWSFGASGDGQSPVAGLIADKWGNLYGTTELGGENGIDVGGGPGVGSGDGTVFELSPPAGQQTQWFEKVLWSFGASGDGLQPFAGLIADKWGNLYGTTPFGGANVPGGTVFELSPSTGQQTQWRERVLWSFGFGDGFQPVAGLLADKWGNLYGTTFLGGASDLGTVFELSPPAGQQTQWLEKVLWSFGASGDGLFPGASLISNEWGDLYGTTAGGGANGSGTVFKLRLP